MGARKLKPPYSILVVDPPWPKRKGGLRSVTPNQTRELDYATMRVEDIFTLLTQSIFPLLGTPGNVFLWTVDEFLIPAQEGMESLGFKLHARLIWDKGNGVAPAFTIRYCHEYLLWFYYPGQMLKPLTVMRGKESTVFRGKQREHSRKPVESYVLIDRLFGPVPKLDVFSREDRDGWDSWGNEKGLFNGR